jgi:hypothetical protein
LPFALEADFTGAIAAATTGENALASVADESLQPASVIVARAQPMASKAELHRFRAAHNGACVGIISTELQSRTGVIRERL